MIAQSQTSQLFGLKLLLDLVPAAILLDSVQPFMYSAEMLPLVASKVHPAYESASAIHRHHE